MEFESVSIEDIKQELAPPKPKLEDDPAKVEMPPLATKEYHVVDPETGQVVGTIDAPLSFCNVLACDAAKGKRNPMGFINPLNRRVERRDLWVHQHCYRPTVAWWDGMWHRLVLPVAGVKLPWQQ